MPTAAQIGTLAHSAPGAAQCLHDIARHGEAERGAGRGSRPQPTRRGGPLILSS
jgi:hypothetical protein